MTVTDITARDQAEALAFEFDLRHSPEKVWRALTDPGLLAEWLLPTIGFKLELGASFKYQTQPVGGWDGVVDCTFREIEPLKKLRYDWTAAGMRNTVTFTLTKTDAGTKMLLVQSGFTPEQKKNLGGARYGWKMMGGKLEDLLARTT